MHYDKIEYKKNNRTHILKNSVVQVCNKNYSTALAKGRQKRKKWSSIPNIWELCCHFNGIIRNFTCTCIYNSRQIKKTTNGGGFLFFHTMRL